VKHAIDKRIRIASCPDPLHPGGKSPVTKRVGPVVVLDTVETDVSYYLTTD